MEKSRHDKINENWRLAEEDIAFQDRLEAYDKLTLTMGLAHLHSREETRRYMMNYLTNMEAMLAVAGLIGRDSLRGRILELIETERQTHVETEGQTRLRIGDWLDVIHRDLAVSATAVAKSEPTAALHAILRVAADCVGCLEERLGKAIDEGTPALAEAIRQVSEGRGAPGCATPNKTTDGAGTPPAADDQSLEQ